MNNMTKKMLDKIGQGAIDGDYLKLALHDGHIVSLTGDDTPENLTVNCLECDEVVFSLADTTQRGLQDTIDRFSELYEHAGHPIEVMAYSDRVNIECIACDKVLVTALKRKES